MDNKIYKLGIIVGRFQVFHSGHEDMINTAISLCDKVGIFVGSSQESNTLKNPFSYETREKILKKVFSDKVSVFPLPDIGVGNNSTWGDYVLKNVNERFGFSPDLLISGKESRRVDWFDSVNGLSIAELYIPKTIDISATQMREHLINNDFEEWKSYTNKELWDDYQMFRNIICECKNNLETDSI
ncbi:MAG: adenylyltransferase/cytidyltransferase family protein [Eubacteriales bacterium]|nr:adenylyltransferase/cytidyltransferase family protein [Eubacteriales bacterium]